MIAGSYNRFTLSRSAVKLAGEDAADFLNRLGSGETKSLKPGQLAATLFMRGDGRLVADTICLRNDSDEWLLVCEREVATDLSEHLDRMHFTEKLTISVPSDIVLNIEFGEQVSEFSHVGIGLGGLPMRAGLSNTASTADFTDEWLRFRIVHGIPSAANELREPLIPLEANLKHSISFTKGCFPGQEMVARIENLGHPANVMVSLLFDGIVQADTELFHEDKKVGRVTSVLNEGEETVGLGFVKWANREVGNRLKAIKDAQETSCTVVAYGIEPQ